MVATLDTADLSGRELDYAVALADGWTVSERPAHWKCEATFAFLRGEEDMCPTCTVPHYCEPYEAEKVLRTMHGEKIAVHPNAVGGWVASNDVGKNETDHLTPPPTWVGNSIAEAVMRCFIGSRLGTKVEALWQRP